MPNQLAHETSPYLLQHANNPVDWHPWGAKALEKSKDEDKPIFLSIGYSACHWCHVMEHESFENDDIARTLNKHFVSIKVDREERPDLDQIYMNAVQMMIGRGGWPMSMFLTPELKPFFGGTYWPPTSKMGMPGFDQVLARVIDGWHKRRPQAIEQADELTRQLQQIGPAVGSGQGPRLETLLAAEADLEHSCDMVNGGFGGPPKFPHPMALQLLMRIWLRQPNEQLLHFNPPEPRQDGSRRHLRSFGRRVCTLLGGCPVAGAAFREDAVRQRAAGRRVSRRLPGHGESRVRSRRTGNAELHS